MPPMALQQADRPYAKHARLKSSTRLDVVAVMLAGPSALPQQTSPYHSSAPAMAGSRRSNGYYPGAASTSRLSLTSPYPDTQHPHKTQAPSSHHTSAAAYHRKPLPRAPLPDAACAPSPPPPPPPPSSKHRPEALDLSTTPSNGLSTLSTPRLKRALRSARSADDTSAVTQVPAPDRRKQLPPTPTTPLASLAMGNTHSHASDSTAADDPSLQNGLHARRHSKPMARKSSSNLFRRTDSRSPLPRDATASAMSMSRRNGHLIDGAFDDDRSLRSPTDPYLNRPDHNARRYPACPPNSRALQSTSSVIMTESRASIPLSASTTAKDSESVKNARKDSRIEFPQLQEPGADVEQAVVECRSPTIPAPSPLPEDSPHKYGLRDSADTPPLPLGSSEVKMPRARRKSSGLEVFKVSGSTINPEAEGILTCQQEAQTLQQASSFLNGLSTARRRAESFTAGTTTDTIREIKTRAKESEGQMAASRPKSRLVSTFQDGERRRKGHNFKSSGFAYSRPLTLAQIKCYRGHARLLLNRNKHAPVECAVCHTDDDGEHFSCSWCALRMCKFCRRDFAERGLTALKERIKIVEMGGCVDSARTSSSESLEELVRVTSSMTT